MWRPNFSSATEGLLEVLISPEQQQAWCRTCVTVNEISSTVTFFECRTKVTALRRISLERLSWSWNIRGYHRLLPFIFTLRCLKKSLFSLGKTDPSFLSLWRAVSRTQLHIQDLNCFLYPPSGVKLHLSSNRTFREKRILGSHVNHPTEFDLTFPFGLRSCNVLTILVWVGGFSMPHLGLTFLPRTLFASNSERPNNLREGGVRIGDTGSS